MSRHIDNLVTRLRGRARFCEDRGEVKTPDLLFAAANEIERLEAALTTIRDTLPVTNDEYARHVFRTAANTLEPD